MARRFAPKSAPRTSRGSTRDFVASSSPTPASASSGIRTTTTARAPLRRDLQADRLLLIASGARVAPRAQSRRPRVCGQELLQRADLHGLDEMSVEARL